MIELITPQRILGTFETHRELCASEANYLLDLGVHPKALVLPNPVRTGYVAWLGTRTFEFERHGGSVGRQVRRTPLSLQCLEDGSRSMKETRTRGARRTSEFAAWSACNSKDRLTPHPGQMPRHIRWPVHNEDGHLIGHELLKIGPGLGNFIRRMVEEAR